MQVVQLQVGEREIPRNIHQIPTSPSAAAAAAAAPRAAAAPAAAARAGRRERGRRRQQQVVAVAAAVRLHRRMQRAKVEARCEQSRCVNRAQSEQGERRRVKQGRAQGESGERGQGRSRRAGLWRACAETRLAGRLRCAAPGRRHRASAPGEKAQSRGVGSGSHAVRGERSGARQAGPQAGKATGSEAEKGQKNNNKEKKPGQGLPARQSGGRAAPRPRYPVRCQSLGSQSRRRRPRGLHQGRRVSREGGVAQRSAAQHGALCCAVLSGAPFLPHCFRVRGGPRAGRLL